MAVKISQLASVPSTNRHFHFHSRSFPCTRLRPELETRSYPCSSLVVSMCLQSFVELSSRFYSVPLVANSWKRVQSFVVRNAVGNSSETPAYLSYTAEASKPFLETTSKPYSTVTNKEFITESLEEHVATQAQRAAKIHDFCFGIPYGGLVMTGELLGFAFSRNLTSLSTGLLYGGGLLALSTLSLKIWRQGKSSFLYILGQAVLSAVLIWKNFTAYSMTKKLFPSGIFVVVSASMLCFYTYVVISGGNPPPKKLKQSASPSY